MPTTDIRSYGLIGHPLGHSFSATYFAEKFSREGISARYDNYDLDSIDQVEGLRALCGFNVTIPYKQAIIPYLAGISDEAREIGAVNTVKVVNGRFYGYNTDVIGFRESLRPLIAAHSPSRALVLGTGGASRAIVHALTTLGISWQYVSRAPRAGQLTYADLRPLLAAQPSVSSLSEPSARLLIVNCTPLGTYPNVDTCPDLPYDLITPGTVMYDLVYNPDQTLFLHRGHERGAITKNGLEMLHRQAEAAWEIWNAPL